MNIVLVLFLRVDKGKSISCVGYLLWFACFHPEKTIAILSEQRCNRKGDVISCYTYVGEPTFLFTTWVARHLTKGRWSLVIIVGLLRWYSGSSIRGMSVNLTLYDEFAFVERANEFYTSTYPVISAGKETKVIITSTANGIGNTYHKIREGRYRVNEFSIYC